jgi:hypothetical protein
MCNCAALVGVLSDWNLGAFPRKYLKEVEENGDIEISPPPAIANLLHSGRKMTKEERRSLRNTIRNKQEKEEERTAKEKEEKEKARQEDRVKQEEKARREEDRAKREEKAKAKEAKREAERAAKEKEEKSAKKEKKEKKSARKEKGKDSELKVESEEEHSSEDSEADVEVKKENAQQVEAQPESKGKFDPPSDAETNDKLQVREISESGESREEERGHPARKFSELPAEIKKMLLESDVTELKANTYFTLVLNILEFRLHTRFDNATKAPRT